MCPSREEETPAIFLIDEDGETRRMLRRRLQNEGYRVLLALDEEDSMDRLSYGHPPADLILINLVGKSPDEALDVGRRVRELGGFGSTLPIVVMAEEFGPEMEGRDVRAGDSEYITYPEDFRQLDGLISNLLHR